MSARVLSGSFAGQSVIVTDASGAYVIPGVGVVAGKRALILIASSGSFALTGEPATLRRSRTFSAAYGAFTLTGEPATLTKVGGEAYILTAAYGAFALTGEPATLTTTHFGRTLSLTAGPGGFGLFGRPSSRAFGAPLVRGTFALTGEPASRRRSMPLAAGGVTLTGKSSLRRFGAPLAFGAFGLTGFRSIGALTASASGYGDFALTGGWSRRRLTVRFDGGSVALQGRASFAGLGAPLNGGVFALTGEPVTLPHGRRLLAGAGAYTSTGFGETGRHGRVLVVEAGDFSLFGGGSGNKVQRLGGDPGVGVIQWKIAGRTIMDWIS